MLTGPFFPGTGEQQGTHSTAGENLGRCLNISSLPGSYFGLQEFLGAFIRRSPGSYFRYLFSWASSYMLSQRTNNDLGLCVI